MADKPKEAATEKIDAAAIPPKAVIAKAPKKRAKKAKKASKPHSGKIEITADGEVHGLGMGAQRKGDRPDVPREVADRLVKEGLAKRV